MFHMVQFSVCVCVCVDHFTGWKRSVCVLVGGRGGVRFESLLVLLLGVCN